MTHHPADYAVAVRHLRRVDPVMRCVVDQVGPCQLRPQGARFHLLARSILSQQISTSAAATIRRRLLAQMPSRQLSAQGLLQLSDADFHAVGVSRQKRSYLRDLAERSMQGEVGFRRFSRMHDEDIISELVTVKGIGRWTAQMFLMFGCGRPDVFAPDDLGLKNAMIRLYALDDPDRNKLCEIASVWRPWRSIASWYLWRSLDTRG